MDSCVNIKEQSEVLNIDLLKGYLDTLSKGMIEQMYELYGQQVPIYLASINDAISENSEVSWQESCHKMKGAAASVGLISLHSQLVALEKIEATKEEKYQFLQELTDENSKVMKIFETWLATII
jgi:HPt (histidine-containing phosphotransfer) domain-containing protein